MTENRENAILGSCVYIPPFLSSPQYTHHDLNIENMVLVNDLIVQHHQHHHKSRSTSNNSYHVFVERRKAFVRSRKFSWYVWLVQWLIKPNAT